MKRLISLTSFLVLFVLIQTGCGTRPATEAPIDVPTEGPAAESPAFLVTPPEKPSLFILDDQKIIPTRGVSPSQTIAFVFPDGMVALKAAGIHNPYNTEDNLTVVGVVESGREAEENLRRVYVVAIDLANPESTVYGKLLTDSEEIGLTFERTNLQRNPVRVDSPSYPTINPIISSNAVCFVVGFSNPDSGSVAQNAGEVQSWTRYCSLGSTDTGELILSVRDNFPARYETQISRLNQSMFNLAERGFPQDVKIDFDQIISEMEGHTNINACNEKQECGSDITGAPNAYFWDDFAKAKDASGGNSFVVTSAILRVDRPIEVPGLDTVQPGDYWVRDWFDSQGNFLGAALLGMTDEKIAVQGQTIPSTPAYFLDVDNSQKIQAWISGWRLCSWCKWQSNCP